MKFKELRWRGQEGGQKHINICVYQGLRMGYKKKFKFVIIVGHKSSFDENYRILCHKTKDVYYPTSYIFPEAVQALKKLPNNPFSDKKLKNYIASLV